MSDYLRIIFAGTPYFAALHLASLIKSPHRVIGVFTQPDRPAGRSNRLHVSAVKKLALQHSIPVFQFSSLHKPEEQQKVANLEADIMVVVAYGLILPQAVLDLPRLGCINVHGSLLPRWRGAAPIQRSLWAGDVQTGVTIIQMNAGIDTGAILYKLACDILPEDTSATLYDKLAKIGPMALLITLDQLKSGHQIAEPQDEEQATYAGKLSKDEARLNWYLPAIQLERQIRAFNPWPVSYFIVKEQLVKVWAASVLHDAHYNVPGNILSADKDGIKIATSNGILILTLLQLAGKKPILVQDLLNSHRAWFIPGSTIE